jgi:hypothetical protein
MGGKNKKNQKTHFHFYSSYIFKKNNIKKIYNHSTRKAPSPQNEVKKIEQNNTVKMYVQN